MASLLTRPRSLLIQLFALVVVPVILLLVGVASVGISLHENAMHILVGERDERTVRAAAEVLADRFAQRRLALQMIADRLADGLPLAQILQNEPALRSMFDGGMIAVDKQGTVIASWPSGVAWAAGLRSTANRWVVEHGGQTPLVILTAQSVNADISLFGAISMSSLNVPGTMGIMRNNPQVRAYLVADDGHVLEDSAGAAVGTDAQNWPGVTTPSVQYSSAEHPVVRYDSQDAITVSSYVNTLNWTVVIQEPWQAVLSPTLRLSLVAPLAMLSALLLAMGVLFFGLTRIVFPLQRLGRATTRLAWGDYEALQQSVGGVQEIRDLQTTMNTMAQRLQQMQSGMHSYIAAILQGQEDERKRLSRELHDDTLQALIALDQQRQMAQRMLGRDPAKVAEHLQQLRDMLDQTIKNLRRLLQNVRPTYIENLGLTPALEALTTQSDQSNQSDIRLDVEGTPRRLPANQELALYRIAQEAVTNALRHAHATRIEVKLRFDKNIVLTVQDDGCGFAVPERPGTLAHSGHYGLMGMVERAEQMQAQFRIHSQPGKGTLIEVCLAAGAT